MAGGRFVPLGAMNVNPAASDAVLPPDVTTTSALPARPAATVTSSVVALCTVTLLAITPPTMTVASDAKPEPLMVTSVSPVVLPDEGTTEATDNDARLGVVGLLQAAFSAVETAIAIAQSPGRRVSKREDYKAAVGRRYCSRRARIASKKACAIAA